jgi:hypothetical protein
VCKFRVIRAASDDGGLANALGRFQDSLDVLGKNLQTLGRGDDILLPAADCEVSGIIERTEVSGVEPSAFQRCSRLVWRIQIAAGQSVSEQQATWLCDLHNACNEIR